MISDKTLQEELIQLSDELEKTDDSAAPGNSSVSRIILP